MKRFYKLITVLVFAFLLFGITKVNADEKVKVYIFEAGGCPYCEAQVEYLKGLSSYGKKFEIVRKELYVDHIDWEQGKDYNLGVVVATEFYENGFKDATYLGTPFVVISDVYAAAAYSTNLEKVINEVYNKGDKDVVGCFEKGYTNCLSSDNNTASDNNSDLFKDNTDNTTNDNRVTTDNYTTTGTSSSSCKSNNILLIVLIVVLVISVIGNIVQLILLLTKKR